MHKRKGDCDMIGCPTCQQEITDENAVMHHNCLPPPKLKTVNFYIVESWLMNCPICGKDQSAPFNADYPMQPMKVGCENCSAEFILTYERD